MVNKIMDLKEKLEYHKEELRDMGIEPDIAVNEAIKAKKNENKSNIVEN